MENAVRKPVRGAQKKVKYKLSRIENGKLFQREYTSLSAISQQEGVSYKKLRSFLEHGRSSDPVLHGTAIEYLGEKKESSKRKKESK